MSSTVQRDQVDRRSGARSQRQTRDKAPRCRHLRVYSFDPSCSTRLDTAGLNEITLELPWNHDPHLEPGPVGEYFEVVDYDPASDAFYAPVDLNAPYLLAEDGLSPSEANPQFHQQMVYAVAMTTVRLFESALGRVALWNRYVPNDPGSKSGLYKHRAGENELHEQFVQRLRIYPHGLRVANAYYHRRKKALLFGYFLAHPIDVAAEMPGSFVFTCLSHDVIVHETTHALLDGLHPYFSERSNPDVLAFHEAFADLVALFQHFNAPQALRHQIARAGGDLSTETLLTELAVQFGQSVGGRGALRDVVGEHDAQTGEWRTRPPDPSRYESATSAHERGSVLTAAVFDAFLRIYRARTDDLFRIATGGSGVRPQGQLHPDLVNRLADEASRAARHFLRMLARALDYCPPVDITFGDYLRAMITADADLVPGDPLGYRVALIEGFRRWGIYPRGVRTLSEDALRWEPPFVRFPRDHIEKLIRSLSLRWDLETGRREAYQADKDNCKQIESHLRKWFSSERDLEGREAQFGLALGPDAPLTIKRRCRRPAEPLFRVMSARPARRVAPGGQIETDLIVEIVQKREGYLDPEKQRDVDLSRNGCKPGEPDFVVRGGCTVVINPKARAIRYVIAKNVASPERLEQQRNNLLGSYPRGSALTYGIDAPGRIDESEPFALLNLDY